MFILATLAVIVVIGALFVGNMQQNKRDAIVLPDAAQSTQPELQPDENEPALLEVTRENVQSIVRSLRRPQYYHQTYTITRQMNGAVSETSAELWVADTRVCAVLTTASGEKHILTDGETLHGYRDRFSILMEHLRRVSEMAKKYDFELLMWGDMFFRLAGGDYFTNFNQNPELGEIPEEVRQLVPENIHLVYWDYFSRDRQSYERNIDAHNAIKSGSWFAGGLWTWAGFAPHNTFSIATMREAMKACRAKGVENVVMTMWGDNGAECSKFAVLPALFTVSQMAQDIDDVETIHANFEREFGIPFEDFRALDLIGTQNDSAEAIYNPEKYLLYCDPFMGQFDNRVKSGDAAGYADCAARLAVYADHAEYGYLFRSLRIFECESRPWHPHKGGVSVRR